MKKSHKEKKMKTSGLLVASILVLVLAACYPQAATTLAPTNVPAVVVQPTEVQAMGAVVSVMKTDSLGEFLTDDKGMTLYLYTKDTPNTSNCYDKCATAWPPLLTTGNPVAGTGIDNAKLGTTQRKDGTMQVTYNGWPLYYYVKDMKAGDTAGQDVGKVWYVISPSGDEVMAQTEPIPVTGQGKGTSVMLGNNMDLGSILVDSKGMTLYLFTKDTPNTSNCYEKCATAWPPLLTEGSPVAGEGIDAALLGTTNRTDGTVQVTYGGWPLYYYVKDLKAGEVTGQNVGEVWFVLSADGKMVESK
jgi:predicted lipoprotein with Yx(FWY)xxD motif